MQFKQNEMMALSVSLFIDRIKNEKNRDECILEREVLKLKGAAISLQGVRKLGYIQDYGSFNERAMAKNPDVSYDKGRVEGVELLHSQQHLTQMQKIIIESVLFSVSVRVLESADYNRLVASLFTIFQTDEALFHCLNKVLNTNFRDDLLTNVLDRLHFNAESLTDDSIDSLKALESTLLAQSIDEEALCIPDSFLIDEATLEEVRLRAVGVPHFVDNHMYTQQKAERSTLSAEVPDNMFDKREYDAKIELLMLRKTLLEQFVKGSWPLPGVLNSPLLQAAQEKSPYLLLPPSIRTLLNQIDNAFEVTCDEVIFQKTTKDVNQSITQYKGHFWSHPQAVTFFSEQKDRLNLKAAEELSPASP